MAPPHIQNQTGQTHLRQKEEQRPVGSVRPRRGVKENSGMANTRYKPLPAPTPAKMCNSTNFVQGLCRKLANCGREKHHEPDAAYVMHPCNSEVALADAALT